MLTTLQCRQAPAKGTAYKLGDAHGLYLYVLPSGTKSWRWKYRISGKEKRLVLGRFPETSLRDARQLREQAAQMLRRGIDPSIERIRETAARALRSEQTFEAVARDWHASQQSVWTTGYATMVLRSLERDVFPMLGRLPVADITTPLVIAALRPVEQRGAIETAHRIGQRISEVFFRAVASGMIASNPAREIGKALTRSPSAGRQPAVRTVRAAREVLAAVEGRSAYPLTKLASRLIALTAVRQGVVRSAEAHEFEDLDGDAPIWRIPAAKMKLERAHKDDPSYDFIVPLSDQAVQVVRTAIGFTGAPHLIFRSIRHPRRPISDASVSKLYRDAGYTGVHVPHGWRSTFSTVMNEIAGVENRVGDRAIIDLMLAHVPPGVEGIYNRAAYMPRRRELAQEWADMLCDRLAPASELLGGRRHG